MKPPSLSLLTKVSVELLAISSANRLHSLKRVIGVVGCGIVTRFVLAILGCTDVEKYIKKMSLLPYSVS